MKRTILFLIILSGLMCRVQEQKAKDSERKQTIPIMTEVMVGGGLLFL